MGFISVLSFAHKLIQERVQPGDTAVDATAGTGADTLLLARAAGRRGHIYSFDIQEEALILTKQRLQEAQEASIAEVTLLKHSHAEMKQLIPSSVHGKIAAIMFNLGYLPTADADKSIMTEPSTTIDALQAAVDLLRPRGIMTAVLYPGHAGGDIEAEAVNQWAAALPSTVGQAILYRQLQRSSAPYLIAVEKK